jgi:hypothetical protein
MKTPNDIIASLTVGGYADHGEHLYDVGEVIDAMKEYAKQWVEQAAYVAMDQVEVGLPVGDAVLELKKQIDSQ